MRFRNVVTFNNQNIGANINGPAIETQYMMRCSAQGVFSGLSSPGTLLSVNPIFTSGTTTVGTLKLQASNDATNPTNWNDISGASVSVTTIGAFLIPVTEVCFRWIRAAWIYSSGAGSMTVTLEGIGWE